MNQLAHNNILKTLIIIFTILVFSPLAAAASKAQDQNFEGYQVKFDYENYPEEREIAYQYYLKRYFRTQGPDSPTPITKDQIGIFLYDLDDDGKKEILTYLNNSGYCGSLGCTFSILKKINNEVQELIKANLVVLEEMKILNKTHLGYHDLLFYNRFGKSPVIWCWNGKYYDIMNKF